MCSFVLHQVKHNLAKRWNLVNYGQRGKLGVWVLLHGPVMYSIEGYGDKSPPVRDIIKPDKLE
jgi:hypothetical protein